MVPVSGQRNSCTFTRLEALDIEGGLENVTNFFHMMVLQRVATAKMSVAERPRKDPASELWQRICTTVVGESLRKIGLSYFDDPEMDSTTDGDYTFADLFKPLMPSPDLVTLKAVLEAEAGSYMHSLDVRQRGKI